MIEILFLGSIIIIFFAYLGYPLSLWLLWIFRKRVVKKIPFLPHITMITTAYNEEKRIKEKLDNTVALDYPTEKLQIIVASDGSTNQTNGIVRKYEEEGIELLNIKETSRKRIRSERAVKRARGDVIIFSDVATKLAGDGLEEIVSNFADLSVGCVSSEDRVIGKGGKPDGEGYYVRYEMCLRRLESKVNSLVGLSGSFFTAKKEVCQDFSGEMQSDFRIVLNSVRMGLRGISDPKAIGYYQDISDEKEEFARKVRTISERHHCLLS